MQQIKVEEGSETFGTVQGLLFTADLSELMYYPLNRQDETFVIPKDMITIHPSSMFWSNTYIQNIEVDAGNDYLEMVDNILYSYDGRELVYRIPNGVNYFAIPSTVNVVCYNALPGIKYLYVPKSVTLFLESFVSCRISIKNIDKIFFESDVLPNFLTQSTFRGSLYFGQTLEDFEAGRNS